MDKQKIWTMNDFAEMNWHDNALYLIKFPLENQEMILDIDYISEWISNDDSTHYSFWISPCWLTFYDVLFLKIDIDLKDSIGLIIKEIIRKDSRPSKNGEILIWNFEIVTSDGMIQFESSGFIQEAKSQPVLTNNQNLNKQRDHYEIVRKLG